MQQAPRARQPARLRAAPAAAVAEALGLVEAPSPARPRPQPVMSRQVSGVPRGHRRLELLAAPPPPLLLPLPPLLGGARERARGCLVARALRHRRGREALLVGERRVGAVLQQRLERVCAPGARARVSA